MYTNLYRYKSVEPLDRNRKPLQRERMKKIKIGNRCAPIKSNGASYRQFRYTRDRTTVETKTEANRTVSILAS
jgi:hypothetical protein